MILQVETQEVSPRIAHFYLDGAVGDTERGTPFHFYSAGSALYMTVGSGSDCRKERIDLHPLVEEWANRMDAEG